MIARTVLRPLVLFALLLVGHSPAWAGGIDAVRDRIREYEVLSKRYEADALKLGASPSLLSKYNYIDAKEQYCGVLADLLDVGPEAVADAVHSAPESNSTDPDQYILYALSLRSYLASAVSLLRENEFSWRYGWNLNCAGVYSSQRTFLITDQPPFSLSISEDRTTLRFYGFVRDGLYDAIAKRLAIHQSIKRLELNSSGGSGIDGMKIGRLLRKRGILTSITGNCYSACTLIFLGGIQRIVPAPYWSLGFHRASEDGYPLSDKDGFYEKLRNYANEMTGSGDYVLEKGFSQIELNFYRPSRKDLCWRNIATVVEGVCEAGSETDSATDGVKSDLN